MKIAMPYQDGVLLEHFGRAKEFIIYNVSDLDPVTSEVIAPEAAEEAAPPAGAPAAPAAAAEPSASPTSKRAPLPTL